MSKIDRSSLSETSQELITKLIRAGYLLPAQCHDIEAVAASIAQLKNDLRCGRVRSTN
jgi:hypothetical protein